MTYMPLPMDIAKEVERQQEIMGWPDYVPGFAEIPDANGEMFWHRWQDLTIALCEQLVEHHTRIARKAILSWLKNQTTRSLRKAGKNILYARLYRCKYLTLLGRTDSTEADMPFPFMSVEQKDQMVQSDGCP